MAPEAAPAKRTWEPRPGGGLRSIIGRGLSFACYPALFPFAVFSLCDATVPNAIWWRSMFMVIWGVGGGFAHGLAIRRSMGSELGVLSWRHVLSHLGIFLCWDHTYWWLAWIANQLTEIFAVDRQQGRLNQGNLHGPHVIVVGNGPSAVQGDPYGDQIDQFDEVIRFNNFVCKASGMERWVGTKTTVHFSDGVLYPTFTEYHVPDATVVLSLFADRFMVAGSYVILRAGADLQFDMVTKFLKDPATTWIDKARIERLKKELGCKGPKHPTSGMLAIDYFVNHPQVQLPVVIHGFDFFQGPHIHYYNEVEPLYERINNRIGVNMHSPHLEKRHVQTLIDAGKVILLKDWVKKKKGS